MSDISAAEARARLKEMAQNDQTFVDLLAALKRRDAAFAAMRAEVERLTRERDKARAALRQIYTGAWESADGLTYGEIADIADGALKQEGGT